MYPYYKTIGPIKSSDKIQSMCTKDLLCLYITMDQTEKVKVIQMTDNYIKGLIGCTDRAIKYSRKKLSDLGLIKVIPTENPKGGYPLVRIEVQRDQVNKFFDLNIYDLPKADNNVNRQVGIRRRPIKLEFKETV